MAVTPPPLPSVYSADAIVFTYHGVPIESGRGEDEFLAVSTPDDQFVYTAGADGFGVWSTNLNTYGTLTLTLMATAPGNAVLSALHNASLKAGGLPGPASFSDTRGTALGFSPSALILKTPDQTFAKTPGTVVWVIGAHGFERFVGSH